MRSLDSYIDEIELKTAFGTQSAHIIAKIEDFIKKNGHLVRAAGKLPSVAQLERLRDCKDIKSMFEYIFNQSQKKTHPSWSEKVRVKGESSSKPFYQFLLDRISQFNNDIYKAKFFVSALVDGVKIARGGRNE
ncbi:MAG: hypothetical protein IBX72_09740 [Nitrospirae bacterium]|nr:hypothetical protein [Nitrospirota bacterium]